MFNKILIANRGDLVSRFTRTCKNEGIESIVAHSEIDKNLKYLQDADHIVQLEGDPISVYKEIPQIIDIAKKTGAEAIVPGWGFVSESPEFAEACEDSGIKFIGPSSKVMAQVGDKSEARKIAQSVGIRVPKGIGTLPSYRKAFKIAKDMALPIKIYAIAGGGGKGIKMVHHLDEFKHQYEEAKREGETLFGNSDVAMQEYLPEIRHVEVQLLADSFGNVVHFGTRDCSTQRRFQKLIEEAPAPCLEKRMEIEMVNHAVALAKEVEYEGAGTIEYMVVGDRFYWLEMNARLQVENGISEEISRIKYPDEKKHKPDILKDMIHIAAGEPLKYSQEDISFKGHSIEFRIVAEHPTPGGFRPAFDTEVEKLRLPHGRGIRTESHIFEGYEIPHQYDSLIAKIITTGRHRKSAISKGKKALHHTIIDGVETPIKYYERLLSYPKFVEGGFSTEIVKEFNPSFFEPPGIPNLVLNAHGCYNPDDFE